jgi:hypothetical protein
LNFSNLYLLICIFYTLPQKLSEDPAAVMEAESKKENDDEAVVTSDDAVDSATDVVKAVSEEKALENLSLKDVKDTASEVAADAEAPVTETDGEQQRTVETIEDGSKKEEEQQPWDACCGMLGTLSGRA